MTFVELTLALRDARVARGLSIEDIADKLKLTTSLVRKLEEGDISSLPHAVYTRGFIRGYAAIVGVNLEEYQDVIDETYPLNVPCEHEERITLVPRRRPKNNRMLLLTCILFGGLLFGAYWKFSQPDNIVVPVSNGPAVEQNTAPLTVSPLNSSTHTDGSTNSTQSAAPKGETKTLTVEELTARELAKGQGQTATQKPVNSHSSQDDKVTTPNSVMTSQTDSATETVKPDTSVSKKADPATTPKEQVVSITAQKDCWMRVIPDGGKVTQMTLKKGETKTYTFTKNIEMRFGDGGNVNLSYNGKAMSAPGVLGKPVTVVYPLQD